MAYSHVVDALLIGWGALLLLGLVFGRLDEARMQRLPRPVRLASSLILVMCAFIWWRVSASDTALWTFAASLFLGMACSFLGDLIMAKVLPLPHYLFLGMGAFGVAHVLYILAYGQLTMVLGLGSWTMRAVALAAVLVVGACLWWRLVWAPERSLVLNIAAAVYALLLACMAGLALGVALQEPRLAWLALGALLFLLSDLLVGNRDLKGGRLPLMGDVIWITYIVGQLLIVSSTTTALRLV